MDRIHPTDDRQWTMVCMVIRLISLQAQIEIRGRFLIMKCKVCNVALNCTLQACLWNDWGKSQNFGLLGRKSSPNPPEYKLAILVTKQWSSMISVCSRLCVQIFCLKINSSWVRRLWGHQSYEFSSYSNIRRQWVGWGRKVRILVRSNAVLDSWSKTT